MGGDQTFAVDLQEPSGLGFGQGALKPAPLSSSLSPCRSAQGAIKGTGRTCLSVSSTVQTNRSFTSAATKGVAFAV